MKRNLGTMLAVLLIAGSASAYANYGHGDGNFAAHKAQKLQEKLGLTAEQTTQVQQILEANKPDKEAMKARMEKVQSEINAVLNDEQKAKYAELIKQGEKKARPGKKNAMRKKPAAKLF